MHCYEWNTGANTRQIILNDTGTYWAKITTPNFCVIYDTIKISVDTTLEIPNIYKDKDTLKTDAIALDYQWFKNNNPIGGNNKYIKIIDTGIYHVAITNKIGCIKHSDTLHIFNLNTNVLEFLNIKGYPNPFDDELVIETSQKSEIQIQIFNSIGQLMQKTTTLNSTEKINTSEWKPGVYFLELTQKTGQIKTFKFIKI